jgi:voltage-gated potassium channel
VRIFTAFVKAIRTQMDDDAFRATLFLLLALLVMGTLVYPILEGWSLVDSLYFSVVTLATVGYGDLHPTTDVGKLFTVLYILIGVGVLVVFASRVVNAMVTERAEGAQQRRQRRTTAVTETGTPEDPSEDPPPS